MHLKIRCDGESTKFCKIFWKLNKAYVSHYELMPTYILHASKDSFVFNFLLFPHAYNRSLIIFTITVI